MGLDARELVFVVVAGAVSLALTLAPLVAVIFLWRRVRRLEARLTALDA